MEHKLKLISILVSATESEHEVESALLLDVVVRESSTILQLLPSEDQPLLVWWDSLLVLRLEDVDVNYHSR